jgi:hypothetical protein
MNPPLVSSVDHNGGDKRASGFRARFCHFAIGAECERTCRHSLHSCHRQRVPHLNAACVPMDDGCVNVVAFQIEIALQLVIDREDVAELWANADDARLEAADPIAGAAVAADLLIDVAHEANLNLLGEEMRRAPVEVHVDDLRSYPIAAALLDDCVPAVTRAASFRACRICIARTVSARRIN